MYKSISACVVLINPEGLVLGVSRKDNHNDFGIIGGKCEIEDLFNPITTAKRETKEETGLDITDLKLVFAMHRNGNMGYTYLAEYSGEINYEEKHIVKWVPFEILLNGSYGKYNKMVSESLTDMGVKYQMGIDVKSMEWEVSEFITDYFDGEIKFGYIRRDNYRGDGKTYEVYFHEGKDDDFEEAFDAPNKFAKGLEIIGLKYGVRLKLTSDYCSK